MIALELLLGCTLALGLFTAISPWVWRRTIRSVRTKSWLGRQLETANIPALTTSRTVGISLLTGAVGTFMAQAVTGIPVVALIAGFVSAALPTFFIVRRARHRRLMTGARWPDAIDHVVGSIRAGLGIPDALRSLAVDGPHELRPEFQVFATEYQRTGAWEFALDALKDRCADPVADRFVELLRLSREVGGTQLVSVLQSFNVYLREDASTRAEMLARQSWITNAARLGVAAPWIVLVMLSLRPEARSAYNSVGGVTLILIGAASCVLAYVLMAALSKFQPEPRWSK